MCVRTFFNTAKQRRTSWQPSSPMCTLLTTASISSGIRVNRWDGRFKNDFIDILWNWDSLWSVLVQSRNAGLALKKVSTRAHYHAQLIWFEHWGNWLKIIIHTHIIPTHLLRSSYCLSWYLWLTTYFTYSSKYRSAWSVTSSQTTFGLRNGRDRVHSDSMCSINLWTISLAWTSQVCIFGTMASRSVKKSINLERDCWWLYKSIHCSMTVDYKYGV